MTDLTDELRDQARFGNPGWHVPCRTTMLKAADRIEELEAALRALREVLVWGEDHEAWSKGCDLIDRALGEER